jgi:photosystem II stability/assembly factor-like uncharacterized protein
VVALGAALALSGCGSTPHVAVAHVVGTPSLSIQVPLDTVGCTASGSCVALGGDGSSAAPSTLGEVRHANGTWQTLSLPTVQSGVISTTSCWTNGCLIGGSQSSGDLLWLYDATTGAVTLAHAPEAGQSISSLSCFGVLSCAIVDTKGITSGSRLSFSDDGGTTWSSPVPITWTQSSQPWILSCSDGLDCLAVATPDGQLTVESTNDAGVTWTPLSVPASWTSLTSLSCIGLRCTALATTSTQSLVVRTRDFGATWTQKPLSAQASALACATLTRCVAVGENADKAAWLATLRGSHATTKSLEYVPTPLIDVSCGTKICAAISVSTVLSLKP